jgi:hypothetical protein
MYRVFKNYDKFPPPYASPPAGLAPPTQKDPGDYEISYGWTAYDSTYLPKDGDGRGAMMEHYAKRCLPIFPRKNDYTCSFISLGNKAYFLTYDDRPQGMPQCCQFSLANHPPRRDFIKHLPYNSAQSLHLDGKIQAYSRLVQPGNILFGYAFWKNEQFLDNQDNQAIAARYLRPQSFFFSGDPNANAPIVSQNYANFRIEQPDPIKTWNKVAQMCPEKPQWCCLFTGDCTSDAENLIHKPSWGALEN